MKKKFLYVMVAVLSGTGPSFGQSAPASYNRFTPAAPWLDTNGEPVNAHGGGVLFADKTYYWFGEKRGRSASQGVNVYSSKDLYNWKNEGTVLQPETDPQSDISTGCVMERPKVLYNKKTRKYVMWFHLELKGQGYRAARAGVAVSDRVTGPFRFVHSFRPNGNMSRDMALFQDDNGDAFQIYSSRENYDLRLVKLTADYLKPTTTDTLLFSEHREAPAIFKHGKKYYLITSGCTGWDPNKARLHTATTIYGPWKNEGDPLTGPLSEKTFGGQSTFILPVQGKKDSFIFMADKWVPSDLKTSSYIWLPVILHDNKIEVPWRDSWRLP